MLRLLRGCMPLLLGLLVAAPLPAQEPVKRNGRLGLPSPAKADPAGELAKRNAAFYRARSEQATRVNGVTLGTTVTTERAGPPLSGAVIRIKWTLRYTGPRPPLTILRPTLDGAGPQTCVLIYAEGADRRVYEYDLEGNGGGPPGKAAFLTVGKGEAPTGTLTVAASQLRAYFTGHWPKAFGAAAPVVRVQLRHRPAHRGEADELDAWTGTVYAPLEKVALKSW